MRRPNSGFWWWKITSSLERRLRFCVRRWGLSIRWELMGSKGCRLSRISWDKRKCLILFWWTFSCRGWMDMRLLGRLERWRRNMEFQKMISCSFAGTHRRSVRSLKKNVSKMAWMILWRSLWSWLHLNVCSKSTIGEDLKNFKINEHF